MNEKIEIKCISQKNCSKIEICALVTISEMVYSHISPFFWTQCIFSAKQYQSSSLQRNASKRQLEKLKAVTNHIAESVCLLRRLSSAVSRQRRAHFPALNRPPTTRYLTTDAIGGDTMQILSQQFPWTYFPCTPFVLLSPPFSVLLEICGANWFQKIGTSTKCKLSVSCTDYSLPTKWSVLPSEIRHIHNITVI